MAGDCPRNFKNHSRVEKDDNVADALKIGGFIYQIGEIENVDE